MGSASVKSKRNQQIGNTSCPAIPLSTWFENISVNLENYERMPQELSRETSRTSDRDMEALDALFRFGINTSGIQYIQRRLLKCIKPSRHL